MMKDNKTSPVTFTKNDVEIIARETAYEGFFPLCVIAFVIGCLMAK